MGSTQWSTRSMAAKVGLNQTAISRIWRTFGLKPHRIEDFKLSTDPQFIDKVRDVVGLYLNPPDAAVVLCVDEKTQVQALDRTAPILPMLPGVPARRSLRLRPQRHLRPLRRLGRRVRQGDHPDDRPAPRRRVPHVLEPDRPHRPRRARRARDLRQRLDPQGPRDRALAETAPPLHDPLHPDLQLLAQPGRALVLRADHQEAAPLHPPQRRPNSAATSTTGSNTGTHNPRPFIWRKTADEILDNLARYLQRINDSRH